MVHMKINRMIANTIEENPGWALVYGRRKVGKTFLLENFVEYDVYFSVRLDRSIAVQGLAVEELGDLRVFANSVIELLSRDRTVVIDEFQRLPMTVLEEISGTHPNGRLILTGSSMRVVNRITGRNSPLLGLLRPFKVSLVSPSDLLRTLSREMPPEVALEHAPLLRDPWTVPFHGSDTFFEDVVSMLSMTVPGLVGEIFTEDERQMTRTYSSILSLIGSGVTDYSEIAQTLHGRGIIKSGASSNVLQYMKNMVEMGLLERSRRYRSRKDLYSIPSLPIRMFYYLDARYGISERNVDYKEIAPTAENLLRFGIEEFIADALVESVGGRKEILKNSVREVDVLVTVRNKPVLVGEVKWGKATRKDVATFLEKVEDMRCRKVIVSRDPFDSDEIDVLTPSALIDEVVLGDGAQ